MHDRYGNRTFDATLNRTTTIPTGCPTAVCNPTANASDNKLKTSDEDYVLPSESVVVNGSAPQTLDDSWHDFIPVWGTFRRMAWNINCHGGGCDIGKALGNFSMTALDLSGLGMVGRAKALATPLIEETGQLFAREVAEETLDIGQTAIRNSIEDVGSTLYDTSITGRRSIRNIRTDITPADFVSNLEQNGFAREVSQDGLAINLTKGDLKYSVRMNSMGGKPPSVNVFKTGKTIAKIRLKK